VEVVFFSNFPFENSWAFYARTYSSRTVLGGRTIKTANSILFLH